MANRLSGIRSDLARYHLIFSAIGSSSRANIIYTNFGPEEFLIDTRDQVIGKAIFGQGECEFKKFLLTLELLRKHEAYDKGPNVLLDIGANIGPICIPAVARGYVERAIAIEPHPYNCKLLRANIALNGLTKSIVVYESACGILDGEKLELEISEDNFGDHRIRLETTPGVDNEDRRRTIFVESNTLDTLCPIRPDQSTLIWMDTQGYEGYILAGGRAWLDARTPLVLEFWPYGIKRVNSFKFLKASLAGYGGFYDLASPERFRPIEDLDELYAQPIHTDILVTGTYSR
jgi:FkbM family methyltransferase